MIPFLPASYYVVVIRMMDAWRPYYRDCRTIRLHTSMAAAEEDMKFAARSLGADRVGIAKLTPQSLVVGPTAKPETPAPTTAEEGASS